MLRVVVVVAVAFLLLPVLLLPIRCRVVAAVDLAVLDGDNDDGENPVTSFRHTQEQQKTETMIVLQIVEVIFLSFLS